MSGEQHGYETSDAQMCPILWLGAFLAIVIALGLWVSSWVSDSMEADFREGDAPDPMAAWRETPDGPLLQSSPVAEIEAHRNRVTERLERYAVIDAENGVYRIPIAEAMKLVVEDPQ